MGKIFYFCSESKSGKHEWESFSDANGSDLQKIKPLQLFFKCKECYMTCNASEKFQLDNLELQQEFLDNAQKKLKIAVISLMVGMGMLTIAALTFIYQQRNISYPVIPAKAGIKL